MVELKVASVGIVQGTNGTVVILREVSGPRVLVIGIGPLEASAIAMELEGIKPPRPMTHDLLCNMIERFGARVRRVVITDLREETFYATLDLESDRGAVEVDSRPSDAMALACAPRPRYSAPRPSSSWRPSPTRRTASSTDRSRGPLPWAAPAARSHGPLPGITFYCFSRLPRLPASASRPPSQRGHPWAWREIQVPPSQAGPAG